MTLRSSSGDEVHWAQGCAVVARDNETSLLDSGDTVVLEWKQE